MLEAFSNSGFGVLIIDLEDLVRYSVEVCSLALAVDRLLPPIKCQSAPDQTAVFVAYLV